jgi:hypothetical protein
MDVPTFNKRLDITEKVEAKRPRGVSKREQVENIKICFIEGCQTRGLNPVCFSGCSHERRKIFGLMWCRYFPNKDWSMEFVTLL